MSEENVAVENSVEQSISDERELDLMELEVYRKAWEEINSALADILAMRGKKTSDADPMQYMRNEVASLKKKLCRIERCYFEFAEANGAGSGSAICRVQNDTTANSVDAVLSDTEFCTDNSSSTTKLGDSEDGK